MAEGRERNRVLVAAVAIVLVALAVYVPVALLAPLPSTQPRTLTSAIPAAPATTAPTLPSAGSSGVTLSPAGAPVAAGSTEPVPMAAAAKIVTALVVLDAQPLGAGRSGPSIVVTQDDYESYLRYSAEGTRAIRVVEGDSWSERETLLAMLIASSNDHAEMLARWGFGSLDGYLAAARKWLTANGLDSVTVVDPTGLSAESVGTGADLAKLTALAMADPFLSDAVALGSSSTIRGVTFDNTIAYRPETGIVGLSRSYTDEAGVCLLFAVPVDVDGTPVMVYGAFLGEPSYDDLAADVDAFLAAAPGAILSYDVVPKGTAVARYSTPWGAEVDAVTSSAIRGTGWGGTAAPELEVMANPVTTARREAKVGTLTVAGGTGSTLLILEKTIGDPGPLWRIVSPGVVVPRFVDWAANGFH